jgi:hypothetical protein
MIIDHWDFLFKRRCKIIGQLYQAQTGTEYFNPLVTKP